MQAAMVLNSSMTAYMIRVDVEFRQDGHAEQHRLQAADPQQHANCQNKVTMGLLSKAIMPTPRQLALKKALFISSATAVQISPLQHDNG